MLYKKNNIYFKYIRGKENPSSGTFYKLDEKMKRIKSLNKQGVQLLCVDGSPRYETRIIRWNTIEKINE